MEDHNSNNCYQACMLSFLANAYECPEDTEHHSVQQTEHRIGKQKQNDEKRTSWKNMWSIDYTRAAAEVFWLSQFCSLQLSDQNIFSASIQRGAGSHCFCKITNRVLHFSSPLFTLSSVSYICRLVKLFYTAVDNLPSKSFVKQEVLPCCLNDLIMLFSQFLFKVYEAMCN